MTKMGRGNLGGNKSRKRDAGKEKIRADTGGKSLYGELKLTRRIFFTSPGQKETDLLIYKNGACAIEQRRRSR